MANGSSKATSTSRFFLASASRPVRWASWPCSGCHVPMSQAGLSGEAGCAPEQRPSATCTSAPEQACAWHSCAGARHSCGTCLLRSSLCARRCAGAAISRTQQREGARARLAARSGRHMPHVYRCTSGPAARCTGAPPAHVVPFLFPTLIKARTLISFWRSQAPCRRWNSKPSTSTKWQSMDV